MLEILQYFFILIGSLFLILILSYFISYKNKHVINCKYFKFSVVSSFIILFLVSVFAVAKTEFRSVFILSFIPLIYIIIQNNLRFSLKGLRNINWGVLFHLFIISIFFFLFQLYFIYDFETQVFIPHHPDYLYFSNIAKGFINNASENPFGSLSPILLPEYQGVSPYHYFESWFTALVAQIFSLNCFKTLHLIIFPFLYVICYFLVFSIINKSNFNKKIKPVIVLVSLFICGIYFNFFDDLHLLKEVGIFKESMLFASTGRRYISWYIIFFIFLNLIENKDYKNGFITISILPILSITSLIPIILMLGIIFLLTFFLKSNFKSIFSIIKPVNLILPIITILLIGIFYLFVGSKTGLTNHMFENIFSIDTLQTKFNVIIKTSIQVFLSYAPFIIIIYLMNKKKLLSKNLNFHVLILLILLFSSLFLWAALSGSQSIGISGFFKGQLCFLNCLIIFLFLSTLRIENKIFNLTFMLLSLFSIYTAINVNYRVKKKTNNYSISYLNNILKFISSNNNEHVLICYANNDYSNVMSHNSFFSKQNYYFDIYSKNIDLIDFGNSCLLLDSVSLNNSSIITVNNSIFGLYNFKNMDVSLENNIRNFPKSIGSEHLILQENERFIKNIFKNNIELLFADELTGEEFYKIKM